jgi:hypothetical protein
MTSIVCRRRGASGSPRGDPWLLIVLPGIMWLSKILIGLVVAIALGLVVGSSSDLRADSPLNASRVPSEPQWDGRVFLRGEARARKDATPILDRPYRPLHVYGNTQRRLHYRDTVIPSRQDRQDRREAFVEAR